MAASFLSMRSKLLESSTGSKRESRHAFSLIIYQVPFLTFRFPCRISNPQDVATWETMKVVKKTLLQGLNSMPASVQMVGIKFMQRMVQVQTAAVIEDKVVCVEWSFHCPRKRSLMSLRRIRHTMSCHSHSSLPTTI